jgi:two-component system, NtrC family, sensor histidine kinase HydH
MPRYGRLPAMIAVLFLSFSIALYNAFGPLSENTETMREYAEGTRELLHHAALFSGASFNDFVADLTFIDRLLSASPPRRSEVGALLEGIPRYKCIGYGIGKDLVLLQDPGTELDGDILSRAMTQNAARTLEQPLGEVMVSTVIAPGDEWTWLRVISARFREGSPPVSLVVDVHILFEPFQMISARRDIKLMLVGSSRTISPLSDSPLFEFVRNPARAAAVPNLMKVVQWMDLGQAGTFIIPAKEAVQLELGNEEAMAVFEPLPMRAKTPWSAALILSGEPIRHIERDFVRRNILLGISILMALGAIAGLMVRERSRMNALSLAEASAKHEEALREVADKIIERLPVGIVSLDADNQVIRTNALVGAQFPRPVVGASFAEMFRDAAPEALSRLERMVDIARSSGETQSLHGEEMRLFSEENKYSVHAVPLRLQGQRLSVLVVIEDLKAVRALEQQVTKNEKLALLGLLAAGLAHEIGTPLGAIRGHAEYVRNRQSHPDDTSSLTVIIDEIDRVTRVVKQLLTFARTDAVNLQPMELKPVLESVVELMTPEAERLGVHLRCDVAATCPAVLAEPDQFRQVLLNLVSNAFAATSRGGTIDVACGLDDSQGPLRARITVRDTGHGIEPEHLSRIFDPFFTTKKPGIGTGLGLSVVQQIVRAADAKIEFASRPGEGTCVTLRWPALKETVAT